jgi:hypothetical protein
MDKELKKWIEMMIRSQGRLIKSYGDHPDSSKKEKILYREGIVVGLKLVIKRMEEAS